MNMFSFGFAAFSKGKDSFSFLLTKLYFLTKMNMFSFGFAAFSKGKDSFSCFSFDKPKLYFPNYIS